MNIKDIRLRKGLTQADVAAALGVSSVVYSRYETGKRQPSIDMLIQMAEKMQEDASAIYNMTDEQAVTYIKTRLTTTAKKAEEIIEVYNTVYGGFSKWDLCNAITEVAHNVGNVENRILFEERALKVA